MPSNSGFLSTPLAQFGVGALALVVGAALLFGLIGLVSEDSPVVDDDPVAGGTTEATDTPDQPTDTGTETSAPTSDPTDPSTTAEDPTTAEPTDDATTDDDATNQFEPSSITIQVLNGWPNSSAPNEAVLACLRDAGHDSLITNRAATRYDTTTVFYTPGNDNQAKAQQVAGVLGISSVQEKPSNLSNTVPVHIVTGGDAESLC